MIFNHKHFAPMVMFLMCALFVSTSLAAGKMKINLKKLNQTFREVDYIRFDKLMSEILNSFKAKSKSSITSQEELMFRLAFNMAMHKKKIMEQAIKWNSWFLRQGR